MGQWFLLLVIGTVSLTEINKIGGTIPLFVVRVDRLLADYCVVVIQLNCRLIRPFWMERHLRPRCWLAVNPVECLLLLCLTMLPPSALE